MMKVLSTKLPADQAERFQEVAKVQGETMASLLRRMVQEYLQKADKEDEPIPASRPYQVAVLDKGHSEYPPHDPYQKQSKTLTSIAGLDSSLLGKIDVNHSLNPEPLSTSRQPVYHNAEPGRSATSPKQSSGIGWLIIVVLIAWGLWSMPIDAAGRTPKRLAQGIGPGICRQRYYS